MEGVAANVGPERDSQANQFALEGCQPATGASQFEPESDHGAYVAERMVDYTREDFTVGGERYHVILDAAGRS